MHPGAKKWSPETHAKVRSKRKSKPGKLLPLKHPLAADPTLHRELIKTGLSWLAVEQIRNLREQGVGVRALSEFYGVRVSTVALASSYTDLAKIRVDDQTAADVMTKMFGSRHRPDVADAYEDADAY
jgi:hypothetical protein